MKTHIQATRVDLTPSLAVYIERKLAAIERMLKKFDDGAVEAWVEVGRTSRHHHKGPVFRAEINLRLPGKLLRAVEENVDIRAALDVMKDKLHVEIEKYKTKTVRGSRRAARKE